MQIKMLVNDRGTPVGKQYSVNGERRSFALLRPSTGESPNPQDRIRDLLLDAYQHTVDAAE
jgi:hypothetical protein